MRIERHDSGAVNRIQAYEPGKITINRQELTTSVILTPESLDSSLPAEQLRELTVEHLEQLFAWQPEMILLGTGPSQIFPQREFIHAVLSREIGFEAITTSAASQTFNLLATEGRRVAAVLLVQSTATTLR